MTTSHAWGVVVNGVIGELVRIEVDISQGLPSVGVIGLADTTIGESRFRIRSAFANSGASWPIARMTIALSPADLPKQGSGIDLAIAASIRGTSTSATCVAAMPSKRLSKSGSPISRSNRAKACVMAGCVRATA